MFNRLKGTKDIYGKEAKIFNFIKDAFFDIAKKYNFDYIETPIIEDLNLFVRSVGETSDIVTKEMYTFKDKGDRNIALRPEATASTIRAFVENRINNLSSSKLFYFGPMFRYERPQKGRFRQFNQGGIELIANKSILQDFEVIKLAIDFLTKIRITDFSLEINNLGSIETRNQYINDLKKYFAKYQDELSELSKFRLEKNVLRILDDKEEQEKDFVKNAPKLLDYLSQEERENFTSFTELLDKFEIKYTINPFLVRGIDYYGDLVFEFVSTSKALGTKSTILAGGRYDGMVKSFEGPTIGSIGFAFGVDRLSEIIDFNLANYPELNDQIDILIAYLNEDEKIEILKAAYLLREEFRVQIVNEKCDIKDLFTLNFKLNPKYLVFKELGANKIKIKTKNGEVLCNLKTIEDFKNAITNLN
ncbi:histidyl-tRNA synthetase [Metamycoplasma arthritidis]|uniref:Histidine--tRNA ligase n=1 Tax=Metamycoplasma arthritidis (strain 158L3-1) TaxID=243272 RepID=B3PMK6_META1|nr:histidine--tRNA ligase [Metamycoplasma arthritidis]ACF07258.1 histidyl-tRNA synthetase [Metamycoplasma arthritidis 158L3-1]VEU78781.1 histidyl-tRNA synthetase [Metamycoplasma arthritidis]